MKGFLFSRSAASESAVHGKDSMAAEDGKPKAGIKKSFSFFGKKDKITKAQLEAKILDLQKQQAAIVIGHNEEKQALEHQLSEMKDQQVADNHVHDEEKHTLQAQIDELKDVINNMIKKHEDDLASLKAKAAEEMRVQVSQMKYALNGMVKKEDLQALEEEMKARDAEIQKKHETDLQLVDNEKNVLAFQIDGLKDDLNDLEKKYGAKFATPEKLHEIITIESSEAESSEGESTEAESSETQSSDGTESSAAESGFYGNNPSLPATNS